MTNPAVLTVSSSRIFSGRLDFRMDVAHGLAARAFSENVFAEIHSGSGVSGWGEAVPRMYVTGESVTGALAAAVGFAGRFERRSFGTPEEFLAVLDSEGKTEEALENPAAFCAVELAMLDLAGRFWDRSVSSLLRLDRRSEPLVYSLVVPLVGVDALRPFLESISALRFSQAKVKVDGNDPAGRVRRVKAVLPDVEIRVDANCSWCAADAAGFVDDLAAEGVVSVEQPLRPEEIEETAALRGRGVLITLDEGIRNEGDVDRAADAGACDSVNIRISKCGGMLGSIRTIRAAERRGLGIQLGAQVGESCILTAAGAALAGGFPSFKWLEGAFGTRLLMKDLCAESLRFGVGGELVPPEGPGLGVDIDIRDCGLKAETSEP